MLYTSKHNSKAETRRPRAYGDEQPWRKRLPADWCEMVTVPIAFEVFRDDELAAERCFGYDADSQRCYYAHRFCIEEPRSDDGEEFYSGTLYDESVTAWLLRDGRWLIHRIVRTDEHSEGQAFYSLSETMPR